MNPLYPPHLNFAFSKASPHFSPAPEGPSLIALGVSPGLASAHITSPRRGRRRIHGCAGLFRERWRERNDELQGVFGFIAVAFVVSGTRHFEGYLRMRAVLVGKSRRCLGVTIWNHGAASGGEINSATSPLIDTNGR
jgi:hypothetical protein